MVGIPIFFKSLTVSEVVSSSEEAPYCFRYALSSSRGATDTYYSYRCATTSDDILLLDSATNAEVKTKQADPTQQGGVANPLSSSPVSIPGVGTPSDPTIGSSTPSQSSSSKSILSTTAIVVIALVGAVILIVGLVVGCCCWRRKRRQHANRIRPNNTYVPHYEPTVTQGPGSTYEPTVMQGPGPSRIRLWNNNTPLGASPDVDPSETGSQWGGPSAYTERRPMNTVYEH